jgi:hypothetical protein
MKILEELRQVEVERAEAYPAEYLRGLDIGQNVAEHFIGQYAQILDYPEVPLSELQLLAVAGSKQLDLPTRSTPDAEASWFGFCAGLQTVYAKQEGATV